MCKGPVVGVRDLVKEPAGGREEVGRVQGDPRDPARALWKELHVLTGRNQKPGQSVYGIKGVFVSYP